MAVTLREGYESGVDLLEEDYHGEEGPVPVEAAEDVHVGRWVTAPVKADPAPVLDPGVPARAADRAAPDLPNPALEPELEEPQEEPEEPSKPCKTCGETKVLSEFPRNPTYKDNHTNKCKPCTYEAQRERERRPGPAEEASPKAEGLVGITNEASEATEVIGDPLHQRRVKAEETQRAEEEKIREFAATRITILPPAVPVPELEQIVRAPRPKKPERFCANGEACISHAQVGRPTKLTHGNTERTCFACQEAGSARSPSRR